MNTFVFIICIVAIVVGADTIQKIYKVRSGKREKDTAPDEEASAKLDQLEERIRVLERIVTESKHDLGREIKNL
jgi:hypothetical protein